MQSDTTALPYISRHCSGVRVASPATRRAQETESAFLMRFSFQAFNNRKEAQRRRKEEHVTHGYIYNKYTINM